MPSAFPTAPAGALLAIVVSMPLRAADAPPLAQAPFTASQAKQFQQQWAEYLDVPVSFTNSIGMKLVLIPPGEFLMGSSDDEVAAALQEAETIWKNPHWRRLWSGWLGSEAPQHRVRITRPFLLGTTEVTIGQFRKFVEATGYQPAIARAPTPKERRARFPRLWIRGRHYDPPSEDCPVSWISWTDAAAFCKWLSEKEGVRYRLPAEAEWEYACRAGSQTRWFFGDDFEQIAEYAQVGKNPLKDPLYVVGRKKPNPFGLYDMHGGVYEWCADWFAGDYYSRSPIADPPGPDKASPTPWPKELPLLDPGLDREPKPRVLRSGAFNFSDSLRLRSAHRIGLGTTGGHWHLGFRVVRTLSFRSGKNRP